LTRSVAEVLRKKKGIRAYAICPGYVQTPMIAKEDPNCIKQITGGKGTITPELVVDAMMFLIQNDPGEGDDKVVLAIRHTRNFIAYSKF
jgi:NAD(P)-dependent dehydrogenase (short-subunit alcohol dehydrogenase family)